MPVTPDVSALNQLPNIGLNAFQMPDTSGVGQGQYGEGSVMQALQQLRGLKSALQSGQLDSATYMQMATPIIQQAANTTGQIAAGGSKAAGAVNPIWQQILGSNFAKNADGQWQATLPLTEQEFAQLPDSAKPTADQINKGLVPASSLPGNAGLNTVIGQQQNQQMQLGNQAMDMTRKSYDSFANDMLGSLTKGLSSGPEGEQFREYYNSLGLLNSGAFNTGLANAVAGNQMNIRSQEQDALDSIQNQMYGTQSNLGVGGLQRQFSLEDFYNQANLQRQLADLQNNAYMNALNQQQQNPWTQFAIGAGTGLASGFGQALGRKF